MLDVAIERELRVDLRSVDHLKVARGDHPRSVRRDFVLSDTNLDVAVLGEVEVVVEDDVVFAKRVDLELVLVVLPEGVALEHEARAPKPEVLQIGFRLVAFIGPQVLIMGVGVEHLHPDSNPKLELVVRAVDLDALTRPELDVSTVDDVVAHQLVFALGVELVPWDVTPNPFFGGRFLVGL